MNVAAPILETRGLEKRFGGVSRRRRRELHPRQGRAALPDRTERRRQEHILQDAHGPAPPDATDASCSKGTRSSARSRTRSARRGVGIKNQVPVVMNGLTVRENLWLAARARRKGTAVKPPPSTALSSRLELGAILGRFVGELAHGQRQWVEIAMVIVCEPNIVLLDEPAAGMSDEETARTADTGPRSQQVRHDRRRRARHAVHSPDRPDGHGVSSGAHPGRGFISERRRQSGRARRLSRPPGSYLTCWRSPNCVRVMTASRFSPDLSLRRSGERRVRRHPGPQRHGQDDASADADRHPARDFRRDPFPGRLDYPGSATPAGATQASATCRRDAASFQG